MIEIVVEHTNTGRTPWCRTCEAHESKTIFFSLGDSTKSSVIHLCDNCLRELVQKINDNLVKKEPNISHKNYIVAKALFARIVDLYDRTLSQKFEPVISETKEELLVLCNSYKDFADGTDNLDSENKTIEEIMLNL